MEGLLAGLREGRAEALLLDPLMGAEEEGRPPTS